MALAESAGLSGLGAEHVTVPGSIGSHTDVKVSSLVAGMVAGADSISDMDLLRHGGMGRAFTAARAATTLGTRLRGYTFGHVRQLDAVASRTLVNLAARVPGLLDGGGKVAFVDIDDTIRETHGYAKQGTGYGYSGVKGLNAQVATVSTLQAAPVIAGIRLRRGAAASAHGTATMIGSALATAKRAGVTGLVTVRADSAYFQHATVTAARRGGAHFSITARMNPSVVAAISRIPEQAWVGIKYPKAIFDQDQQRWISDAEVAEIDYTAFTSRTKKEHVTARLIVRRVKRLNPRHGHGEQGGLLDAYRHHAVFTDSPGAAGTGPTPATRTGSRAVCWMPIATPRCSPTHRFRCWPRRPLTGTTRSSSRSSPTSRTGRWPTAHPACSPPTVPGPCWPRSRSTSPALPEYWHRPSTPAPAGRPCSTTSSRCPPGSPPAPDPGDYTSHATGPGNPPGRTCSTPPSPPQR